MSPRPSSPSACRETRRANLLLLRGLRSPRRLASLPAADWNLLLRLVQRLRLAGRLEADLTVEGVLHRVPAGAARSLRAARLASEQRAALVRREVERSSAALEGLQVPLVLLKGAAYAQADLPPARGRLFTDVDLLVPEERLAEVERTLLAKGWRALPLEVYDERYYRRWMHEIPPLVSPAGGTSIDLHHRLLPRTHRCDSDPRPLFEDAVALGDDRLRILAPADMVLHAIIHLLFEADPGEGLRLRDLVDAGDLLRHFGAQPGFWSSVVPRARRLGWERPLFYGLRLARRLLGTDVPDEVLRETRRAAPPRPLLRLMDVLLPAAILPGHPDRTNRGAAAARWLLFVRSHWLRMPVPLLARHLGYKTYRRLRRYRADPAG